MTHPLAKRLSDRLGGDAGVGYALLSGSEGLFPEETAAVARAIPMRQAEFAAGRRAARNALAQLGHPACAIPVGDHRAPIWPEGMIGTITHDKDLALAAVLPRERTFGIGIDLTEAAPLPGETRHEILPHALEASLTDLEARAGFSAKESLFKALFPHIGTYFGFDTACVTPALAKDSFQIALTQPLKDMPEGTTWQGHIIQEDDHLLTALRIPHR
jgi:4'-phosphopantetheinyl transferase EntD